MDISLKSIERGSPAYKEIRRLYKAAFPLNERAPFFLLSRNARKSIVDWWGIYDGESLVGFFYVINKEGLTYVFYFAILESCRAKGYGSRALAALKEKYRGNKIFLAIEQLDERADNYDLRVKRRNFYLNNGFEDLNIRLREASVVFDVLGIGGPVSKEEYRRLIDDWLGRFFGMLVKMEIL